MFTFFKSKIAKSIQNEIFYSQHYIENILGSTTFIKPQGLFVCLPTISFQKIFASKNVLGVVAIPDVYCQ